MGIDGNPAQARTEIRTGRWSKLTAGLCPGYRQANLVILPERDAYDFLRFAQRNPQACPVIEVGDAGDPCPRGVAPDADLRTEFMITHQPGHMFITDVKA